MVPKEDWKWFGNAGHFICGHQCRFHLCTQIGKYLVSTVGEYLPDSVVREVITKSRGARLQGKGDAREADYMKKLGFEDIGCDRKYETMVFLAGKPCDVPDCNCGLPVIEGHELDFDGYNNAGDATKGHMKMCDTWAEKE